METREIRLEGSSARGRTVSGSLLRDLLDLLVVGTQQALRVRTEGRSTARGSLPGWIAQASEFRVEIVEGSTVLRLEAPSIWEAAPDHFRQAELFPELDLHTPAIDYLTDSLSAALGAEDRPDTYDAPLLETFRRFQRVFDHGVDQVEFRRPATGHPEVRLRLARTSLAGLRELERKIPRAQHVRVSGKLDAIRHSDHTFTLLVGKDRERVRGVTERAEDLRQPWGALVVVSGTAHFTSGGLVQRIEAERIEDAGDRDLALFSFAPMPLARPLSAPDVRKPQGPRSGLNAIFGRWPGEETDEEIRAVLDEIS
jgi:hypothetical protein